MTVEIRNIVWQNQEDKSGNNCHVEMFNVKNNREIVFLILDHLLRNYSPPVSFDWCTRNSHRSHHWDLYRRVTRSIIRDG